jgi:hypothetical protein
MFPWANAPPMDEKSTKAATVNRMSPLAGVSKRISNAGNAVGPQLDCRVATGVTALPQLLQQSPAGQTRIGRHPLAQVRHKRINQSRKRLARSVH